MSEVVLVGPDDWQVWRDIRLRSLADAPDAFGSTYDGEAGFGETEWRDRLWQGPRVLVTDQGQPVALGGGYPLPDEVLVVAMWTDPDHRRRGHATAVLDTVVGWARERGLPVSLHVNVSQPGARATYERYGFVGTGDLTPLRPGCDQQIELLRLP